MIKGTIAVNNTETEPTDVVEVSEVQMDSLRVTFWDFGGQVIRFNLKVKQKLNIHNSN